MCFWYISIYVTNPCTNVVIHFHVVHSDPQQIYLWLCIRIIQKYWWWYINHSDNENIKINDNHTAMIAYNYFYFKQIKTTNQNTYFTVKFILLIFTVDICRSNKYHINTLIFCCMVTTWSPCYPCRSLYHAMVDDMNMYGSAGEFSIFSVVAHSQSIILKLCGQPASVGPLKLPPITL